MDWKVKAIIQKVLALSRIGDYINHRHVTLSKNYHKNVVTYQTFESLRRFKETNLAKSERNDALEIGTGYSLVSAVVTRLLGFKKVVTVDITKDANYKTFKVQINLLKNADIVNDIIDNSSMSAVEINNLLVKASEQTNLEDALRILNIFYIAPYNIEDLEQNNKLYSYITSQVVFEHIPPPTLEKIFKMSRASLEKSGCCVHTINFIDHFANPGLFQDKNISVFNFLKYSDKYWNFWAGNPIAYTNRLSYSYYVELCKRHGFENVRFEGENYRPISTLKADEIHPDIYKKYAIPPLADDLMRFQRVTIIIRY